MGAASVITASSGQAWQACIMGLCTGFSLGYLFMDVLNEKTEALLQSSFKREEAAWKMVDEWRQLSFDVADRAVELKKELDEAATRH